MNQEEPAKKPKIKRYYKLDDPQDEGILLFENPRDEIVFLIEEYYQFMINPDHKVEITVNPTPGESINPESILEYFKRYREFFKLISIDFEKEIKPRVSEEAYALFESKLGSFLGLQVNHC